MDSNAGNDHDAEQRPAWTDLRPGQEVYVRERGYGTGSGIIDAVTPDGSVLWVRMNGHSRRLFLASDPVAIFPDAEQPDAF